MIHIADSHWEIGSHSPHIGDDLESGRRLELRSGLAEIMFESGVRAVLQGPATMVVDSKMSASLLRGKLNVAVIDPDAHGFVIRTPGMKYTDLGTEFGVNVEKDGAQEMHVFRGMVKAEAVGGKEQGGKEQGGREQGAGSREKSGSIGSLPPPFSPLLLSANQAVRVAAAGKPLVQIAASERQFVRRMPAPEPFPLFSTGVGLARGESDPHWEIVAVNTDREFERRPATVAIPAFNYEAGSPETAQWISLTKVLEGMPEGCRITFRTRFDLTGFDPATARIDGLAVADNWVSKVKLNGKTILIPRPPQDRTLIVATELHIDSSKMPGVWQSGVNTLEIIVENGRADEPFGETPMALYFRGTGVAMRSKE